MIRDAICTWSQGLDDLGPAWFRPTCARIEWDLSRRLIHGSGGILSLPPDRR